MPLNEPPLHLRKFFEMLDPRKVKEMRSESSKFENRKACPNCNSVLLVDFIDEEMRRRGDERGGKWEKCTACGQVFRKWV